MPCRTVCSCQALPKGWCCTEHALTRCFRAAFENDNPYKETRWRKGLLPGRGKGQGRAGKSVQQMMVNGAPNCCHLLATFAQRNEFHVRSRNPKLPFPHCY